MKSTRVLLAVLALGLSLAAASVAPRSASADIGPCAGCASAQFTQNAYLLPQHGRRAVHP